MSRFGPEPRDFFEGIYQDTAPWDIGAAQPALLALFDEFPPGEPILDVGCGTGDLAIALAQRGHRVLGADFAERAIAQAKERAAALPSVVGERLAFTVADALRPSAIAGDFAAVVDSGFLHLFDDDDRDRFAAELARTLAAGGRYYLLAFATEFDLPNTPRRVGEEELRRRFAAEQGWAVLALRPASFESRIAPVPAIAACIERRPTQDASHA